MLRIRQPGLSFGLWSNLVCDGFLLFVKKNVDKDILLPLETVISKQNVKLSHKRFLF